MENAVEERQAEQAPRPRCRRPWRRGSGPKARGRTPPAWRAASRRCRRRRAAARMGAARRTACPARSAASPAPSARDQHAEAQRYDPPAPTSRRQATTQSSLSACSVRENSSRSSARCSRAFHRDLVGELRAVVALAHRGPRRTPRPAGRWTLAWSLRAARPRACSPPARRRARPGPSRRSGNRRRSSDRRPRFRALVALTGVLSGSVKCSVSMPSVKSSQ